MNINEFVLRPGFSWRAIYRRHAWNVRSLLALHPRLFIPVMRLKSREHSWMVQDNTQFVIEGYPRSANTFALTAFTMSQGRHVNVSHHMHAPANVMLAIARNLPTLVLIRRPLDAITSWIVKYPYKSIAQACKYYIRFYQAIAPYQDKYILATFEEATSDFGAVVEGVNQKFGTHFNLFQHTEENVEVCYSRMRSFTFPLIAGVDVHEAQAQYPSPLRDTWKAAAREMLQSDRYRTVLAKAEDVYVRMLAKRISPTGGGQPRRSNRGLTQTPKAAADPVELPTLGNLLAGKNVFLTGAGRNIGRGIAIETGKAGARIHFTDIDSKQVNDLEAELASYGIVAKGFVSDICKREEVDRLCEGLLGPGESIDILINNVGIDLEGGVTKGFSLDEWGSVFDTNVLGPVYLTRRISQMMIDHHAHGNILFITSIHQWLIRRHPSYSASKAALGMIIKELAVELAPHGIRVNGIAPGYAKEDAAGNPLDHKQVPLYGSSINPSYIGRAAVYLSADYFSKFTTGTVLKIDAGLSLYNHLTDQLPGK